MSLTFQINVSGQLIAGVVPVINTCVQDDNGIYQVNYSSLNGNIGVLDVRDLVEKAIGNKADDFLVAEMNLFDSTANVLVSGREIDTNPLPDSYSFINPQETYQATMVNTGYRLTFAGDGAVGEASIFMVVLPLDAAGLLACCVRRIGGGD